LLLYFCPDRIGHDREYDRYGAARLQQWVCGGAASREDHVRFRPPRYVRRNLLEQFQPFSTVAVFDADEAIKLAIEQYEVAPAPRPLDGLSGAAVTTASGARYEIAIDGTRRALRSGGRAGCDLSQDQAAACRDHSTRFADRHGDGEIKHPSST
jgi:hypothetical protein